MNDTQEDKLGMYFSVVSACEKHAAVWQALPAFVTAFGEFTDHVDAIRDTAEGQETGIAGNTREKNRARKALADTAYPLGMAIQAWALVSGNAGIGDRVYRPHSDYLRRRDTEAETMARIVLSEGTAHLADLADYGVTQAKLDALSDAADAYHAALTAPRSAITDRSAATAALLEHFAAADKVLKERMDKLVPILASDTPKFGVDYQNARIIVDSGGGGGGSDGDVEGDGGGNEEGGGDAQP